MSGRARNPLHEALELARAHRLVVKSRRGPAGKVLEWRIYRVSGHGLSYLATRTTEHAVLAYVRRAAGSHRPAGVPA